MSKPLTTEELDKNLEIVIERAHNNLATGMFADLDNQLVNGPRLYNEVSEFIADFYIPKAAVHSHQPAIDVLEAEIQRITAWRDTGELSQEVFDRQAVALQLAVEILKAAERKGGEVIPPEPEPIKAETKS